MFPRITAELKRWAGNQDTETLQSYLDGPSDDPHVQAARWKLQERGDAPATPLAQDSRIEAALYADLDRVATEKSDEIEFTVATASGLELEYTTQPSASVTDAIRNALWAAGHAGYTEVWFGGEQLFEGSIEENGIESAARLKVTVDKSVAYDP